jgi:membrane-bound lytic murein transglycosylase B
MGLIKAVGTLREIWLLAVAAGVLVPALAALPGATASADSPKAWVEGFWPTAKAAKISRKIYDHALGDFQPDPDVLERASTQAEFKTPMGVYIGRSVSDERIADGKAMLAEHGSTLRRIEARFGVDRYVVLAIWGIESHYGKIFDKPDGVKKTIRSLATLAYSGGGRAKYGRTQLIAALRILQRGDVGLDGMTGSWAGAMGHTQFIPTTYNAYAVDFDGDKRRNIWTSIPDALASTANYLRASKWSKGKTWGYEVVLPDGVDLKQIGAGKERTLGDWTKRGVVRAGGGAFPRPGDRASLYLPSGRNGPAFLLLGNFRVIKRYNNANAYALAVGYLSDRLRGGNALLGEWPAAERPVSDAGRMRVQQLLADRGLYSGPIDGKVGRDTREAIRSYQKKVGLAESGFETLQLLQLLEAGR